MRQNKIISDLFKDLELQNIRAIFLKIYLFIYFGLHWVFIATCGLSLVAARRLLIVVASLVAEHGL